VITRSVFLPMQLKAFPGKVENGGMRVQNQELVLKQMTVMVLPQIRPGRGCQQ